MLALASAARKKIVQPLASSTQILAMKLSRNKIRIFYKILYNSTKMCKLALIKEHNLVNILSTT